MRRHKAMIIMFLLLLAPLAGLSVWAYYLETQIDAIPRFEMTLDRPDRPAAPGGKAQTFLFVGVDSAQAGGSFRNTMQQVEWPIGSFRSDVIMVVHLAADRRHVQVVSLPRDSWVPIPGHGHGKINAAFSLGGPELLARTVEDVTGAYVDHVVVIDYAGFEEVSRIVDGVPVYLARPESLAGRMHPEGWNDLRGREALDYVRQRYDLPGGDFERVHRQQDFLRGLLERLGDVAPRDPVTGTRLAGQLSRLVAVDADLTTGTIRSLAWDLRHLQGEDVRFFTAPTSGLGREGAASVVRLDTAATRELFRDIRKGTFRKWEHEQDLQAARDEDALP
ncbi:LCP family protein [Nocardioides guangzhouensis]|uniref:LCP family protein n=1 Tax=Nocardioides guangzhouensis TaxID=2497878 RepID=UPI0014384764|nr:LCP family protein [Nocardioides guangzhouensis]